MHPFYDANRSLLGDPDTRFLGLASMAAYLAFWAAAIPFVLRALTRALAPSAAPTTDATSAGTAATHDRSEAIVRERYAAGEIAEDELRRRLGVLREESVRHRLVRR